jgi:methyl-accepting chemotaxis protein
MSVGYDKIYVNLINIFDEERPMGYPKNRRKKKIIDFIGQLQMAIEVLMHVILFGVLTILVIYMDPLATMFSEHSLETHQNLLAALMEINFGKWPFLIIICLVVSLSSVLFSHRILGPSYKIKMMLNKYASRDLVVPTYLRKHDYLMDLVEPMNDLRGTITEDISAIKEEISKLEKNLSEMPEGEAKHSALSALEGIRSRANSYFLEVKKEENAAESKETAIANNEEEGSSKS